MGSIYTCSTHLRCTNYIYKCTIDTLYNDGIQICKTNYKCTHILHYYQLRYIQYLYMFNMYICMDTKYQLKGYLYLEIINPRPNTKDINNTYTFFVSHWPSTSLGVMNDSQFPSSIRWGVMPVDGLKCCLKKWYYLQKMLSLCNKTRIQFKSTQ